MSTTSTKSPLDELSPPNVDDVWERIEDGKRPSRADLERLIEHQRIARERFRRKETEKEER